MHEYTKKPFVNIYIYLHMYYIYTYMQQAIKYWEHIKFMVQVFCIIAQFVKEILIFFPKIIIFWLSGDQFR